MRNIPDHYHAHARPRGASSATATASDSVAWGVSEPHEESVFEAVGGEAFFVDLVDAFYRAWPATCCCGRSTPTTSPAPVVT